MRRLIQVLKQDGLEPDLIMHVRPILAVSKDIAIKFNELWMLSSADYSSGYE